MNITPFGKEVRKLRIEASVKLKDMAKALGVSSAYLSGVEMGRKALNEKLVEDAVDYFQKRKLDASGLLSAAVHDITRIDLGDYDDSSKALLIAFARRLPELPEKKKKEVREMLDVDI